jgi:hypothetical protein
MKNGASGDGRRETVPETGDRETVPGSSAREATENGASDALDLVSERSGRTGSVSWACKWREMWAGDVREMCGRCAGDVPPF